MSYYPNPNLQVVSITDFSPGIYQYGVGKLPVSYSTESPPGSASLAIRCINRPGIGLVPFYGYLGATSWGDTLTGNSPGGHPWVTFVNAGIGCIGGVGPNTTTYPGLLYQYTDSVATSYMGIDSTNQLYTIGSSFWSTNGTTVFNQGGRMWDLTSAIPVGTSFDISSQQISVADTAAPMLFSTNVTLAGGGVAYVPDILGAGTVNYFGGANGNNAIAAFAQSSRIFAIRIKTYPTTPGEVIQQDDLLYYTDPPSNPNGGTVGVFQATPNQFSLEETSGIGAWGSVSTGELVLIRRGQGAVIVYGDPTNPTSQIKLPGVQGTGQVMQKLTPCTQGAVYVTQAAGAYAWNGSNVSQKISPQLPDQALVRQELENGGWVVANQGFVGCRSWHDMLNDFVFFPNNYVFDSIGNSWWLCEDPNTYIYGGFAASKSTNRFMYTAPKYPVGTAPSLTMQGTTFDAALLSPQWTWISNPIRSAIGTLSVLQSIEIVASNPDTNPCTIVITPTIPPGQQSSFSNNTQSLTFTIPPQTSAFRAFDTVGYTEYNICVKIVAANQNITTNPPTNILTGSPAPILHEIHLAFSPINTSGTGQ